MNFKILKELAFYFIIFFFLTFLEFSICPFYNLTGLPCPSCGMIRGIVAILRGDFILGLKYNIFSLVILIVTFFLILSVFWKKIERLLKSKILNFLFIFFIILLIIYGAIRIFILFYDIEIYRQYFILFEKDRFVDFLKKKINF